MSDKYSVMFEVTKEQKHKLRMHCAKNNLKIKEAMTKALEQYLNKNGEKK